MPMSPSPKFLAMSDGHFSMDYVVRDGKWHSDGSMATHYLDHSDGGLRCSPMAGPPSPSSAAGPSSSSGRECAL